MKLTNEQIQAILDGAPDGATKFAEYIDCYYFKPAIPHGLKLYSPFLDKWQWVHDCSMLRGLRDLSDLREILTLRQRVEELEAQLGKTNNKCVVYDLEPAQHERAIRDHLIKLGWTPPKEKSMSKFDPIRDCPHGSQKGKCDSCDLEQAANFIEQQQQRIEELEQRNDELAATVEGLRDALRHLHHNAKASGAEMGLALDVAEEALESTPPQNLNTVKREAIIDALNYSDGRYIETHSDYLDMVVEYANTKYPSGKDGE